MKETGRQLNVILALLIVPLVIFVYFIRLMAHGGKLQRDIRDRSALEADIIPPDLDEAFD